ncbi:hypothetical protein Tco_0889432 [Tanacetum coccineum]
MKIMPLRLSNSRNILELADLLQSCKDNTSTDVKMKPNASSNFHMAIYHPAPVKLIEVPHDEHLDSDDDEVLEDYTIPYDQYLATKDSQDVPTEASPDPPYCYPNHCCCHMLKSLSELDHEQFEEHHKLTRTAL